MSQSMKPAPDGNTRHPRRQLSVKVEIPKSLDRALEMTAAALDLSKRQLVSDALEAHLEKLKPRMVAAIVEFEGMRQKGVA